MEEGLITVQTQLNSKVTKSSFGINCSNGWSDTTLSADLVLILVDTVEINKFDLLDNWCLTGKTTTKLFPAILDGFD